MQTSRSTSSSANSYFFVSHWRVPGRIEQVFRLFQQVERLPDWWPAVYRGVEELEAGGPKGLGRTVALRGKGWLPYSIRWQLKVTGVEYPRRIDLSASGDLEGRGTWLLAQAGEDVDITFEWEVTANKPLLKSLSPFLKPLFAMNHRWAMRQGEISLKLEMQRLQARSMEEALKVPRPPGPEPSARALAIMAGATGLALGLVWRAKRRAQR